MTHVIGWASAVHRMRHRDYWDAGWWREAVDREGGVHLENALVCTCGWTSVVWTVQYVDQWQQDGERHGAVHDRWRWDDSMPDREPSAQLLPGVAA